MRRHGPLVADVSRGRVHVEAGDPRRLVGAERVALVAQFSMGPNQPRSLSEYLRALEAAGFRTLVMSTCESSEPLVFPHGVPDSTVVVRRPNLGYDFGSWATALGVFPQIRSCPTVLLTNDSLLGPFDSIDALLDWTAEPGPDIRGLTASYQFVRHIQSYFVSFRGGILADEPWRRFFNGVRVEPGKDEVVLSYELGLSRTAFANAYSAQPWATGPELGVPDANPTVDGWRNLIRSGVPFLKRTIMTHPSTTTQATEAAAYINQRFSVDITEW